MFLFPRRERFEIGPGAIPRDIRDIIAFWTSLPKWKGRRLDIELNDVFLYTRGMFAGMMSCHSYDLSTGEVETLIYQDGEAIIPPGLLIVRLLHDYEHLGPRVMMTMDSFVVDDPANWNELAVARDAILEHNDWKADEILERVLPYGQALFRLLTRMDRLWLELNSKEKLHEPSSYKKGA